MEKNPNSWRLLTIFFAMAMLFALGSVDVKSASIDRSDAITFVNLPPGQEIIAITVIENLQIIDQMKIDQPSETYQIARGVSVPYRGLMNDVAIYNVNDNQKPIWCLLQRYYCQTRPGPNLNTIGLNKHRQGVNVAISNFAADLGVRYTSSVT